MHIFTENKLLKRTVNSNVCCYCNCSLAYGFFLLQKFILPSEASSFDFSFCLRRGLCPPTFLKRQTCSETAQKYNHPTTCQSCRQAPMQQQLAAYSLKNLKGKKSGWYLDTGVRVREGECKCSRHANIEGKAFFLFSFF